MAEEIRVEECEECSNQNILYDAIQEGKAKRLCKKCLATTGAIEIKKPKKIDDIQTGRRSVKEILMKMSGLAKEKEIPNLKEGISLKQSDEITLNDLIERKRQREKEQKHQEEKQKQEIHTQEFQQTQTQEIRTQEVYRPANPKHFDFSMHTTKSTKIGDLLKLKKEQEINQQKEEKKEQQEEKQQEKL